MRIQREGAFVVWAKMYNNCLSRQKSFPRRKIFGQNPSVRSLKSVVWSCFSYRKARTPHNFYLNVENAPAGSWCLKTRGAFVARKTRTSTAYICALVLFTTKWSHKEDTHSFEVKEYVGEFKGVVVSWERTELRNLFLFLNTNKALRRWRRRWNL